MLAPLGCGAMLAGCRSLIGYDDNRFSHSEGDGGAASSLGPEDASLDCPGGCANVAQEATCVAGHCECPSATPDACDGHCVDVERDPKHCGTCGTRCETTLLGSVCVDGRCECAAPKQRCEGSCVDPLGCLLHEHAEMVATDGAEGNRFGAAVALNAKAGLALVGAPYKTVNDHAHQGAFYEFAQSGNAWLQTPIADPEGGENDDMGLQIDLSADSKTAFVAAPYANIGKNPNQGAVYVFMRSGTSWLKQKLTDNDGIASDLFGSSVAVSADGQVALIGSSKTGASQERGAVHVYARSGNIWNQQEVVFGLIGSAVDLSADGNTALVGAGEKTMGANENQGDVVVYRRVSGTLSFQQRLAVDKPASDFFGYCVALAADGQTALVTAPGRTVNWIERQGAGYVFQRDRETWIPQAVLTVANEQTDTQLGYACAISADGNLALLGTGRGGKARDDTAAYLFRRAEKQWVERAKLVPADDKKRSPGYLFGHAVALDPDGRTALVGAPSGAGTVPSSGAVFLFDLSVLEATSGAVLPTYWVLGTKQ